jgi:hypothetical protein
MAPKVHAPNALYTGKVGNVQFVDGVADVKSDDISSLSYFEQAGYTIDGTAKPKDDDLSEVADRDGIDQLTKPQLVLLAQQKGISVPSSANKAELQKLLSAKDAADPGSQPAATEGAEVTNSLAGEGPETGAAEGAVFGATPAASDTENENAQGEQV